LNEPAELDASGITKSEPQGKCGASIARLTANRLTGRKKGKEGELSELQSWETEVHLILG